MDESKLPIFEGLTRVTLTPEEAAHLWEHSGLGDELTEWKGHIDMDEHRPHVVIPTPEAQHVYPLAYFEDFAKGEEVDAIPLDVMRVIVAEWLSITEVK